jgi:ferredoxin
MTWPPPPDDDPAPPAPAPPGPPLRRPRGADRAVAVPSARDRGTPPVGLTGPLRQLLGPVTGSLRMLGRDDAGQVLRVDWPQCRAHGLCHEVVPELIHLDEWGYPLFDERPLAGHELPAARKAVQVCPTLALRLTEQRRS